MIIKSMAVFAGMLDAMDFHIGRFITYLKKEGLYENTIFIVTADNGQKGMIPAIMPHGENGLKQLSMIVIMKL